MSRRSATDPWVLAFRVGCVATSAFLLLALLVVIGTSLARSGYLHVPPDDPGPR